MMTTSLKCGMPENKQFKIVGRCPKSQQVQSVKCSNVGTREGAASSIVVSILTTKCDFFCGKFCKFLSDKANLVVIFRFHIVVFGGKIVNLVSDNANIGV
jgi:hypothetical protein